MADTFRVSFDESITVDSSTYAVIIAYESHVLYYFTATNLHAGLNCLILLLHCAFFLFHFPHCGKFRYQSLLVISKHPYK